MGRRRHPGPVCLRGWSAARELRSGARGDAPGTGATVPDVVWGRDELGTGEMWNSNSLTSWLLARSGHDAETIRPPDDGRAPGWSAGLVVADRQRSRVAQALPVEVR